VSRDASPETISFLSVCQEALSADDYAQVEFSVVRYVLDGWEERYPFPDMPRFLIPRYWDPGIAARAVAAAEAMT
jgi:hypothetical protein